MDINGGTLKSDAPVDIQSKGSKVTADSMHVYDNGKLVVFEANVRVHIDPVQMKAAQAERGDADASN
jgi:lipopolysaccharide export system protein LptC